MNETVINIEKLNKTYATGVKALKNVTLEIRRGEIFSLLGPNGAGKTTLINIIAGLTKKTSGEATVFGKDVVKDYRFTRSKIGLVQQEINADFFLTVRETAQIQAGFFGLSDTNERIDAILKSLSLWDKRDTSGRNLSGGMKRRVMIAKALVHDPEVLFLDEPTAGVDVELRANLWELVREFKKQGKTIILTTHYLEEAEELADRVGIIYEGRIILVEDKAKLISRFGKEKIQFHLDTSPKRLPALFKTLRAKLSGTVLEFYYDPDVQSDITLQKIFTALNRSGAHILHMETKKITLNDVYLRLIHNANNNAKA